MLIRTIASAIVASLTLSSIPLVSTPLAQAQQTPQMVTVLAGTIIPLTLVNPIKSKSTHPGDSLRAVVAFPVTVGEQVAIPAGTYVEGTLLPPAPKVKHQPDPDVQIHFTRLVFANGYSYPIDAIQSASLDLPGPPSPDDPDEASPRSVPVALAAVLTSFVPANPVASLDFFRFPSLTSGWRSWMISLQAFPPVTPPPDPVLPKNGPSVGMLFGIGLGVTAALVVVGILFHHKASESDYIVHGAGWQLQMKLAAPLTLNPALTAPRNP